MRRLALLLVLLLPILATSACEEPPNREINQAQGAIDAARAAGADKFAAAEFEAATAALDRARAAVEQSDYRQALSQALDARDQARAAARRAAEEQASVRSEVDARVRDAEATIETLSRRLKAPDAARIPRATIDSAGQQLERAREQLAEVRKALVEARLLEARDAVLAIGPLLESTLSEIDAAAAANPPRRPARRTPSRSRR